VAMITSAPATTEDRASANDTSAAPSATEALATFLAATRYDDLPASAIADAKLAFLDWMCQKWDDGHYRRALRAA